MSQIKLLHSGGNGVILAAPDSNPASDRTLKLPGDADGTILTSNSSTGKILQVVSNSSNTQVVTSGATISDILTVSITPASTSNKILVLIACQVRVTANSNAYAKFDIYRGSSSSGTLLIRHYGGVGSATTNYSQAGISYLDSPNTTSATTYTLAISRGSGNTTSIDTDNETYTITAQEVAA